MSEAGFLLEYRLGLPQRAVDGAVVPLLCCRRTRRDYQASLSNFSGGALPKSYRRVLKRAPLE